MQETKILIDPNYSTYVRYKDRYIGEIVELLSELGTVETPEIKMPKGAGVTAVEVLNIVITGGKDIGIVIAMSMASEIGEKITSWLWMRIKRGDGPRQATHVKIIYGPDGTPLKEVVCDKDGKIKSS